MDELDALTCLSALSQSTRLAAFRLLVAREPNGVPAGEIARLSGVPQNTMSAHLAVLTQSGLIRSERKSRSIIYRADLARLRALLVFFAEDCCGGRPELCEAITAGIEPCCPPSAAGRKSNE